MRSLTGRQRTWRVSRDVKDPLALPILPALLLSVPSGTRGTTTGHSKKPEKLQFNSSFQGICYGMDPFSRNEMLMK